MFQEVPGQSGDEGLLRSEGAGGQGLRGLRPRQGSAGKEVQGQQEGLEGESQLEIIPPVFTCLILEFQIVV